MGLKLEKNSSFPIFLIFHIFTLSSLSHFDLFLIHLIISHVEHNTTYFPYIARKVEHITSFHAPSSLYYIFIYIKPGDKLKFAL